MSLLQIQNVSMHFGGLKAISDLSFVVEERGIRGLIGPKRAGKTKKSLWRSWSLWG